MQRSTRMPLMAGFTKTFDLAEASVGCWFLERDFVGLFGSAPLSAPEIDLSVFPIVPPVEPACANAVVPTANDASIANMSINTARRPAFFPFTMLRPRSQIIRCSGSGKARKRNGSGFMRWRASTWRPVVATIMLTVPAASR